MSDDVQRAVRHNYDGINSHVEGLNRYVRASVAEKGAGTFAVYAKWIAIMAVAGGAAGLLLMVGYSFLLEPKIRVVTETKVVEKPVSYQPTIIVGRKTPERDARQAAESRIDQIADSTQASRSVFNYVIFRTIPFGEGGLEEVVVGMRYDRSEDETPSSQWCYVEKGHAVGGVGTKVSLAVKTGASRIDGEITNAHARELGTTRFILERAQRSCEFR